MRKLLHARSRRLRPLLILGAAICLATAAAVAAPTISVSKISEDAGTRSDQRPIPIGFYAPEVNKTFVCWMGANSQAVVKALDHATGTWSPDTVVGVSPFVDKHNYPGMLRGPDDRIYVFYGCHNSTLRVTVSPEPLSIEGKWDDRFVDAGERASYPAPVVTADGAFYVFYRDTRRTSDHSDDRPYQYVKSTDLGKTWTRRMAVDPYPRTTDSMCEVYNGKVSYQPPLGDQPAKIHLAWTIAGEKAGRHAHATYGRNVYYAYLDPRNDHLYNIAGVDLGAHIDKDELDAHCLVLDTGIPTRGHWAGLQVSVSYRDNGAPLVYFDSHHHGGRTSATWTGSEWTFTPIVPRAGDDPGERTGERRGDPRDLEKCGPEAFRVYVPAGEQIRVFKTTDAGAAWALETTIDVGQRVDRVHVIDRHHPEAKLMITESGDGDIRIPKRDIFIGRVTEGFEPPYAPPQTKRDSE